MTREIVADDEAVAAPHLRDVDAEPSTPSARSKVADAQAAVLDALPVQAALVDRQGVVVAVNEAWRGSNEANRPAPSDFGVGRSYLEVCDRAVGEGAAEARKAAAGLRQVLQGEVREFVFDYPCQFPGSDRQSWFRLMVTPLDGDGLEGAMIVHLDITERTLNEAAVRNAERLANESELRLGFALEAAKIGDWTLDLRTNVAHRSLRHDQCFGYTEPVAEWGYDTFLAHIDPVDRGHVNACFERALAGEGEYDDEFRTAWPDGSVHWLWTRGRFYFDDAGKPCRVAGIVVDITARKRTEESLRASEERFSDAFEHAPIGVALVSKDGRLLKVNRALCELVGFPELDLLRRTFDDISHPDDIEGSREVFRRLCAKEAASFQLEKRYRHASGQYVTALKSVSLVRDADGEPDYYIAQIQDITERKRAENAAKRALERLSEAQRIGRIGDWELDLASHAITWSRQVFEVVGRDPSLGPPGGLDELATLLEPSSVVTQQEAIERAIATGEPQDYEIVFVKPGGERVTSRALAVTRKDERGEVLGLYGTLQDISAQTQAELALRASEEQLRQAQKMEAVGQLAGGVAHDFNNLLSVVLSYCTILLEDLAPDDPMRLDVEEVRRAGQRATDLTRQLLAFSRKQVLQSRVLDVNRIVFGLENMLRRLVGEGIDLTFTRSSVGMVYADSSQIEQIVLNLAVNARDAMPRGGTLTIETNDKELGAGQHDDIVPGHYVVLAVSDSGIGMDAETRERIFEPFFTTKELGKGTGLGLSTVFGIVKQSEGYIRVQSEPSRGATFEVYLPRTEQPHDPVVALSLLPTSLRGTETILLVEDEEQVRVATRTILKRNGYNVLDAQNAGEAFLICEQFAAVIHLLITDVVMPRMTGKELAKRLAPTRPSMQILFVSGYTADTIVDHGVLEPGIDFLQKPVMPHALLRKVRELLDRTLSGSAAVEAGRAAVRDPGATER